MEFLNINRENIQIGDIPAIILRPNLNQEKLPTIVFYHGWSSRKESQVFRGSIIASLGFQVILPDAIHHGSRGEIDYLESEKTGLFWEVVLNNLNEWKKIKEYIVENLKADPLRIGVAGHSMGGFTASGIFAENMDIKACTTLNGSFNWIKSNEIFKKRLNIKMNEDYKEIENRISKKNPNSMIENLAQRPILILHGESDSIVSIAPQREFYEDIKEKYENAEDIKMISYPNLDHFVTTNMLEDMCEWFSMRLK